MTIDAHIQQAVVDRPIQLFVLDATSLGLADPIRFTNGTKAGHYVMWGGDEYAAVPVKTSGWAWDGVGPMPTPKITVGNPGLAFTADVMAYNDFRGATLTRYRTFERFLDDGSEPSTDDVFTPDVFRVKRKSQMDPTFLEWELGSVLDQLSVYLPRRLVLKNACPWRYRELDPETGDFDYSKATCPYAGTAMFDDNNRPTLDKSKDWCPKYLSGCEVRYGLDPLPFGGFPGVNEVARQG